MEIFRKLGYRNGRNVRKNRHGLRNRHAHPRSAQGLLTTVKTGSFAAAPRSTARRRSSATSRAIERLKAKVHVVARSFEVRRDQAFPIGIFFSTLTASGFLGTMTRSAPLSKLALTWLSSMPVGS